MTSHQADKLDISESASRDADLLDLIEEVAVSVVNNRVMGVGEWSTANMVRAQFGDRLIDALITPSPVSPELAARLARVRGEARDKMRTFYVKMGVL